MTPSSLKYPIPARRRLAPLAHTRCTCQHKQAFLTSELCVQNALPDILAVVQVALEGAISSANAQAALARGNLPQVSAPALLSSPL